MLDHSLAPNFKVTSLQAGVITPNIAKSINKAVKFVAKDKGVKYGLIDPVFGQLCFNIKGSTLTLVATDCERMYISEPFEVGEGLNQGKYLVSPAEARALSKLASRSLVYLNTGYIECEKPKKVTELWPGLHFYKESWNLYCVANCDIITRGFPEYQHSLPPEKNLKNICVVNNADLTVAVKGMLERYLYTSLNMSFLGQQNCYRVELKFCQKQLSISLPENDIIDVSRGLTYTDSNFEFPDISIAFNAKYLTEILKVIPVNTPITILNTGLPNQAVIFAGEGSKDRIVLMPLLR